MRPAKNQTNTQIKRIHFEVQLDERIVEQVQQMESYTKISKTELVETALKRFISGHKDYFPE